jgi:phasin family protein
VLRHDAIPSCHVGRAVGPVSRPQGQNAPEKTAISGSSKSTVGQSALEVDYSKWRSTEGTRTVAARCTRTTKAGFPGQTAKDFQMNNVEQFQQKAKEQGDAAMASANNVAASVQAITAAHADYTRKALQDGSEFITKLASLKAPTDVMALQSEYAKTAYEAFVAESKKIAELYADLAKQTYKPLEGLVAQMTPSHN